MFGLFYLNSFDHLIVITNLSISLSKPYIVEAILAQPEEEFASSIVDKKGEKKHTSYVEEMLTFMQ